MPDDSCPPLDDLELVTLDKQGKPPTSRIKDVKSAHALYCKLKEGDEKSSKNRAEIQAMFDGEPPWDEHELVATGQGDRCNLNFDEAAAQLEFAMSGYIDLLNAVETLVTVKLKSGVDPAYRLQWEQIIAEETTNMIRSWPKFTFNFLQTCHYFVGQGVCANYFSDAVDWRWNVAPIGDFLIPRRTTASEEDIQVVALVRAFQVHKLYQYIKDPEVAKNLGWNVPAVQEAIRKAVATVQGSTNSSFDWELLQTDFKNNDLHLGATAPEVKVVHMLVPEFDDTVSHYIFLEQAPPTNADAKLSDGFLFKKISRFESYSQAFVLFSYGIGTNGCYHGIRGLGYKIMPHVQVSNRLRSQMVDSAMLSGSLLIQPTSDEAMDELALVYYGPYSVLPPGVKVIERGIPNLSNAVVPVLNEMNNMIQNKTGQYSVHNAFASGHERSKFEVAAQLDNSAKMSVTMLNLFYEPWGRLLKEVMRRIFRKGYRKEEPGGRAVHELKERLALRGVPEEILYEVDLAATTANRAIGAGSEAARQMVFAEMFEYMPSFDTAGRQNLLRDRVASRVGYNMVDRYVPPTSADLRPPLDISIAQLETNQLMQEQNIEVKPNDPHVLHARVHLAKENEILMAVDQGQMDLMQVIMPLQYLHSHAATHIEAAFGDPATADEVAMMRQNSQQAGEIIMDGIKHLQKLQRQAAEQGAEEGAPGGDELPDTLKRKIIEHNAKLEMMKKESELRMNLAYQKAQQDRAAKEADIALKLRIV